MILYLVPFLFACLFGLFAFIAFGASNSARLFREFCSLAWLGLGFAAVARYLFGACLALFLVGCTSPIDRALDKADELNAKNAVVVCVEKPTHTECAVSGDNFEGVFLLRCSWYYCEEFLPKKGY